MDETDARQSSEPAPPDAIEPPPAVTPSPPVWPVGTGTAQPPNTLAGGTATPNTLATPAGSGGGRRRAGILGAGLTIALVAGTIGVKWVGPLLLGGAVVGVINSVFGGPFDRLPSDARDGFEARIEAILPAGFEDRSDAEQTAWFDASMGTGLQRLDDAVLDRRFALQAVAVTRADIATCAKFVSETPVSDATSEQLIGKLEPAELREWFDIAIQAIEAEAGGKPVPRTIVETEFEAVFTAVIDGASTEELAAMEAWFEGGTTDEELCSGIRAFHAGIGRLGAADRATVARYDVQP